MNCIDTILTALGRLNDTYGDPDLMFQTESECLEFLTHLDGECAEAFAQVAQDLFQKIGDIEDAGYKFQLVLYIMMQRRLPGALDLVIDALKSDSVRDKGALIDLLENVDDRRLISILVDVIQRDAEDIDEDEPDELGGEVRVKAIQLLLQLRAVEVADFIKGRLHDPAYMVREAAVQFLVNLHQRDAAELFLKRIELEAYPSILTAMILAISGWGYKEALPALRSLLGKAKTEKNPRLKGSIQAAILKLEHMP